MAKKEIYRLDIKIGVEGDSEAKKKLTATERFAKQTEKRTKALDKIKASPSVRLKDKLSKPLEKMEGKLSKFSKAACSKLAAIATAGAVMIGGLGIAAAVRDFSNFEQGLANVKAISGATAQEMQVLGKEARRLGAETAWSAKDVTDAEMLLSQAGFKVQETIAALPGLLDMASAGDIQLAEATDIAAGTIRAFGMEAKQSAHVADVLALTASRTNSDISGIGESMKYVAPVSKSLGISFEETSAAIGMLADANIKGLKIISTDYCGPVAEKSAA
ncbi:phage tail tape measure protein [Clostridium botulinum]|uniref:phage tail tape measure protein n=1 Tax=Clostridium botulinum TaxID=1491 RepID=UPI003A7FCDE5